MMLRAMLVSGMLAVAGISVAQTPAFDPRSWKTTVAGPKTQVLVLGSPHLSNLKGFQAAWMVPLLDRLAAFRPTIITIEALSGQQCAELRRYPTALSRRRRAILSFDRRGAQRDRPRPVDRSRADGSDAGVMARHAPAGRRGGGSPALCWRRTSRPPPWCNGCDCRKRNEGGRRAGRAAGQAARRPGDARPTRITRSGAVLAARLGLDRVYPVDDHTADAVHSEEPGYAAAIKRIWSGPNQSIARRAGTAVRQRAGHARDLSPVELPRPISAMRSRPISARRSRTDTGILGAALRRLVGGPHLPMVANIRATFAPQPGARVLAIVGSSHKAYFDAYLDMMHEVELVDAAKALR